MSHLKDMMSMFAVTFFVIQNSFQVYSLWDLQQLI